MIGTAVVRRLALVIAGASLAVASSAVLAQAWPAKPMKLIVPYPPGGIADTFARSLSGQLGDRLGQQMVAENRPGGSLIIGAEAAAKSPPDGYTFFFGSVSSLAINVEAFRKLPYDPVKDFAPVSLAFYTPLFLVVGPSLAINNVRELIAQAKAKPGTITFASIGYGSSVHLAAEMFKNLAQIELLHVPYKGTTVAFPDILAGRVNMMFDGGAFLPQVKAGKAKLLAVTSPKRLEAFPDVPTMVEAGVPGYEMIIWFGVVAPAGTPTTIVDRVSREIGEIVKDRAFRERFADNGFELLASTPAEMGDLIRRDIVKWGKLLRDAGVKPE